MAAVKPGVILLGKLRFAAEGIKAGVEGTLATLAIVVPTSEG
jgi:hypothetical protein